MKRQFSAPHFWLKMGKYNQLKNLKKTKARVTHECSRCEETILAGDYYYKEALKDAFLQSLNARSFCVKCYEQFGESLLTIKSKRKLIQNKKSKKMSDFI
jgi:hypothetical protein